MLCDGIVGNKDKDINCKMCEFWYNAKCLKMEVNIYDFYSNEETQWICELCMTKIKDENELRGMVNQMIKLYKRESEMNEKEREDAEREREEIRRDRKEAEKEREEIRRERKEIEKEREEAERDRSKLCRNHEIND